MNTASLVNFATIVLNQASEAAPSTPQSFSWVGIVIQVLLFLGTVFMVIWRTSATTKEMEMKLQQTQPKMDCLRCRAEVDAKIASTENHSKLLEQRLDAIERTLGEIKKAIEELRKEVRARPLSRTGTNPRFQVPDSEDDQG